MRFLSVFIYLGLILVAGATTNLTLDCKRSPFCEIQNAQLLKNQKLDLSYWSKLNFSHFKNIKITNSELYTIPRELLTLFPNLQSIAATSCGLQDISKELFGVGHHSGSSVNLKYLILSTNNLTTLQDEMFAMTKHLRTVDLSHNQISVVEGNTFRFLYHLTTLKLGWNRISTLKRRTFRDLKELIILQLCNNQLEVIDAGMFQSNKNLGVLNMQSNFLKKLSNQLFDGLRKLVTINLAENELEHIEENVFSGLHSVNIINLSGNQLRVLVNITFSGTINNLYLNNSNIEHIDFDIFSRSVIQVWLNNNMISVVQASRFNTITSFISLANNQLRDVSNIQKFKYLEILDLSNNVKLKVKSSTFAGFQALDTLFLAVTNAQELIAQKNLFEDLPYLRLLDISFNNLKELNISSFSQLPNLVTLDISNANLTEIVAFENMLEKFPELKLIKLSGNEWSCSFLNKFLNFLHFKMDADTEEDFGIACKNTTQIRKKEHQISADTFRTNMDNKGWALLAVAKSSTAKIDVTETENNSSVLPTANTANKNAWPMSSNGSFQDMNFDFENESVNDIFENFTFYYSSTNEISSTTEFQYFNTEENNRTILFVEPKSSAYIEMKNDKKNLENKTSNNELRITYEQLKDMVVSTEAIVVKVDKPLRSKNQNHSSAPALLRIQNSQDHDHVTSGVSKASWLSIWMLVIIFFNFAITLW